MAASTESPPIFLAFLDGVFHYECRECDALCCRGQGFSGSLKREMTRLLEIYPALANAARTKNRDIVSFATPTSGCYFLDSDRACRIEKQHGKALKPGVCSLFPFNRFTLIGDTVAVRPHFLCPLRLNVPARPGEVAGTHSKIAEQVRETGLLPGRPATPPLFSVKACLRREKEFLDACSSAFGKISFHELLRSRSEDAAALDAFLARALAILGIAYDRSGRRARDEIDALVIALATPFRLEALAFTAEEVIRLLALCEVTLRHMVSLSPQPLTPQGAWKVIQSALPALKLLAKADSPLRPPGGAKTVALTPDMRLNFFAIRILNELNQEAGVLTALERSFDQDISVSDRSVLLSQLGRFMAGRPQRQQQTL